MAPTPGGDPTPVTMKLPGPDISIAVMTLSKLPPSACRPGVGPTRLSRIQAKMPGFVTGPGGAIWKPKSQTLFEGVPSWRQLLAQVQRVPQVVP